MNSDLVCYDQCRVNRFTFHILCDMLRTEGRLKDINGQVSIEEQVVIFLHILAHHVKIRTIRDVFRRSTETVSRHFNLVLHSVLRLHGILLHKPEPVAEDSMEPSWRWFKNCLGALDGTHIRVHVRTRDQASYRTRKGEIATNVLGICSRDLRFIYVLPGWEGSASDSRILRDAISRPNGFKVPIVDAGYANVEGFLAPYRGTRYHIKAWRSSSNPPSNAQELFNFRHSSARNVVERCFGILKQRWGILRSPCFYPIMTQVRIILACFLVHNLIRGQTAHDPAKDEYDALNPVPDDSHGSNITHLESSDQWTAWRNNKAQEMYQEWLQNPAND